MPGDPKAAPPPALPSVPVPPAAAASRAEPFGDILAVLFEQAVRFFTEFDPEETDEAFLRDAVTAARATVKRVEQGAVAVSSPAVLRKLRAAAKALKRQLTDAIDDDVADEDVDADPSGEGDASVVKKGKRRAR